MAPTNTHQPQNISASCSLRVETNNRSCPLTHQFLTGGARHRHSERYAAVSDADLCAQAFSGEYGSPKLSVKLEFVVVRHSSTAHFNRTQDRTISISVRAEPM